MCLATDSESTSPASLRTALRSRRLNSADSSPTWLSPAAPLPPSALGAFKDEDGGAPVALADVGVGADTEEDTPEGPATASEAVGRDDEGEAVSAGDFNRPTSATRLGAGALWHHMTRGSNRTQIAKHKNTVNTQVQGTRQAPEYGTAQGKTVEEHTTHLAPAVKGASAGSSS